MPTRVDGVVGAPGRLPHRWVTRWLILLIVGAPCASACYARFDAEGPNPLVRVQEEKRSDCRVFRVEDLQTADVTVTFKADATENVTVAPALPLTLVVHPHEVRKAFVVTPTISRARWRFRYTCSYRLGNMNARHDDTATYRLPYDNGATHLVIQGFNGKFSHTGEYRYAVDWRMPYGTRVLAAREGVVVYSVDRFERGAPDPDLRDQANQVVIRHADGTYGEYSHLSFHGVRVKLGQHIQAGDLIGLSGSTGYTTEPHLHFTVSRPISGESYETFPIRYRVQGSTTPVTLLEGHEYTARP